MKSTHCTLPDVIDELALLVDQATKLIVDLQREAPDQLVWWRIDELKRMLENIEYLIPDA